MDAAALQEVRQMPLFASLADGQLDCITPGDIVEPPVGSVLVKEGESHAFFYLMLEGEVQFWRSYDRQDVLMGTGRRGDMIGEMSLLLESTWSATGRVAKPTRLFRLHQDGFWKMLGSCPSVTRQVLRTAATRFRNIEGFASQREKLVSLGTMAAGLAHELNNPASAALRAASYLQKTTDNVRTFLCAPARQLPQADWERLLAASEESMERMRQAQPLEAVARSDQEGVIGDWLERNNVRDGWNLAGTLVAAGIDVPWLDAVVRDLPPASRAGAVEWIEARLHLKMLLKQVETSTSRVAELVKAVKSYTHMDQSPMQEIDIHEGIETTLMMLGHKLKGVTLKRAFDRNIPHIIAYGGELNQVWTNLIDNAIDAVNGSGIICIGTCGEAGHVTVEIVDNGPGIPPAVQPHIFEPFFTTKSVGSGTGLGLVISNRIIADRHGGEIEFESKPGETRFRVRLPITGATVSVLS